MNIVNYYEEAMRQGLAPSLLQYTHPEHKTPLHICGINPSITLMVKDTILYKNGHIIGHALDIFDHLNLKKTSQFFPAFIGYFSYEFAKYFGLSCNSTNIFPDAFFRFYEQGIVIDNNIITHHDQLPSTPSHKSPEPRSPACKTFHPLITKEQFLPTVQAIKQRIIDGDVYQVNLSLPFFFELDHDGFIPFYETLRAHNESPFMGMMAHDDFAILSGSPERLFSLKDGIITARPIAGTKRRGENDVIDRDRLNELTQCPKENAEHAMLVDLIRNDLNKITEPGTLVVSEDRSIEFYSHVMHLVSEVRGKTNHNLKDIMAALFPGGTITGAPKQSVMSTIAELESFPRGPYTGSLGYISSGFGIDFNILIRSVLTHKNQSWVNAGAGIVIDSDPEQEWLEIHAKAQAIRDIQKRASCMRPLRPTITGPTRKIYDKSSDHQHKRVLFIENHDSFSFNIIEALNVLGASVKVMTLNALTNIPDCSHVVIGPGPGNPTSMPLLTEFIKDVLEKNLPLLGICLGHQAIGHYFGATIKKAPLPIHGQPHTIHHNAQRLFLGLSSPALFTRYHSLVIEQAPKNFVVNAYSDDDCIMAISHSSRPIFGVQFHPESYLSKEGHSLLNQFLRTHA